MGCGYSRGGSSYVHQRPAMVELNMDKYFVYRLLLMFVCCIVILSQVLNWTMFSMIILIVCPLVIMVGIYIIGLLGMHDGYQE